MPNTTFTDGHFIGTAVGVHEAESGNTFEFHTTQVGYPDGLVFRPLMWPSILMGLLYGPVAALNYTWTFMASFNAICGYLACRSLGVRVIGSLLGGVMVGWNHWVCTTLGNGQIEQSAIGAIALIWACGLLSEKKPLIASAGMFAIVVFSGISVPNCALTALLGLPILFAGRLLFQKKIFFRWSLVMLAALLGALVVNQYQSINFDSTLPQFFKPRSGTDASMASNATLESLISPADVAAESYKVIHSTFLGTMWIYAGLAALFIGGRKGWLVGTLAIWLILLALGPTIQLNGGNYYLPIAVIQQFAEILQHSSSYYRFVMGAIVALGIGAAVMIHSISKYSSLAALLIALYWGNAAITETNQEAVHPLPYSAKKAFFNPILTELKGTEGAVLDLPLLKDCDKNSFRYLNAYWLHRRPILHSMMPPVLYGRANEFRIQQLKNALDSDRCESYYAAGIKGLLQKMDIGAVVIHQNGQCRIQDKHIDCIRQALGTPTHQTQKIIWWDNLLQ